MEGTFMGDGDIENRKKRLSRLSVLVGSGIAGFIPSLRLVHGIVILFGIVGRIVTRLPQIMGKEPYMGRNWIGAPHVLCAHSGRVNTGYQSGTGWGTYRGCSKSVLVKHTPFRQVIYVWCGSECISIGAYQGAIVLTDNP